MSGPEVHVRFFPYDWMRKRKYDDHYHKQTHSGNS